MADEKELYVAHPAMFRNRPLSYFFWVASIPAGAVLGYMFTPYAFILSGVGCVALLVWWLNVLGTKLTVTDKRTLLRRGILSKHINEVLHSNVRNIQVNQSLLQRLFGVGLVGISCSGQSGIEIEVVGVPDPEQVRKLIDEHRQL